MGLTGHYKKNPTYIYRSVRRDEIQKGAERLFKEIMAEKIERATDIQIHETQNKPK